MGDILRYNHRVCKIYQGITHVSHTNSSEHREKARERKRKTERVREKKKKKGKNHIFIGA